jgi:cell division protein FtsZ
MLTGEADALRPRICVMGVGGAGGNAVDAMVRSGLGGVDFIAANTDAQALRASLADCKIQLGRVTTRGLGAGAAAGIGRHAAQEAEAEIVEALAGVHMLFIAAGMGGGTGSGAAPVVARIARSRGILTVGIVSRPFAFEGRRRSATADQGVEALAGEVDTLIVVPNQNLFRVAHADTSFRDAFRLADDVLERGVRSISDLIVMPGLINLDFADVRVVMSAMGAALIGTGEASGPNRAMEAAELALANPLLDGAMNGAKGVIISITGGEDMRLMEIDEAASRIRDLADPEADIIWGSAFDPSLGGTMRVSIIATGIGLAAAPAVRQMREAAAPTRQPVIAAEPVIRPPLPVEAVAAVAPPVSPPEARTAGSPPAGEPAQPSLFERMAGAARAQRHLTSSAPISAAASRSRRIVMPAEPAQRARSLAGAA